MSDEKLSDYYGRTASLLRKVKGEDNANATGVGASMLMMTIDAFLKGLHNPELRLILSRESPSTLQAALEKAEAAQRQMEVEARLKREQQTLKDNDQMKEAMARMLQGQPVSAELRAKMQEITGVKPSSKSVNYADTAEIIPPPLSFYPPQQNQQGTYRQAPQATPPSQLGQWRQTTLPAPARPTQQLWQQPWNQPNQQQQQQQPQYASQQPQTNSAWKPPHIPAFNQNRRGSAPDLNHRNSRDPGNTNETLPPWYHTALSETQRRFPTMTVDSSQSQNPIINGATPYEYRRTPLCVNCGQRGHLPEACTSTPLQHWEHSFLWSLVTAQRQHNQTAPTYQNNNAGPSNAPQRPASTSQVTKVNLIESSDERSDMTGEELMSNVTIVTLAAHVDHAEIEQTEAEAEAFDLASHKRRRNKNDKGEDRSAPRVKVSGTAKKATTQGKRVNHGKPRKPMKPINALYGKPPLEVSKILAKIMVEVPFT
ncbi:unnamed protein product [Zymoseptoria tritici ST99CH_1A5]|uniref:CCHC-type domain-containing protein n=1 Tax=Zymoseptoria tritici ST99CH_1A5 TaxID=1276529 RepID=A0A1Y6M1D4_ZYMTR|nr:unnamed protein product [Zymoseptoria tritici ST99CH_1A5]